MSIFSRYFVNIYMIAALAWTAGDAQASSLCSAVQGLQMERLRSWNELKAALNLIETCFSEARAAGGLATEAQKVIIEKCGECISSISELWLEGSSGRQAGEEIARQLYARNNGILKGILDMNNEKVRLLQEQMLDTLQDTSSFFASAAWQDPQYLISLASYWLSWNGYYSGLLLPQDDPKRKELLRKATQGFARTFLDFKEDGIVIKSLFGRALCYKDLGAYDKALLDINSVIARLRREDPLYVRALYEKALISYTTGNYEPARGLLKELEEDVRPDMISRRMRDAIQQMEKKILIAMLEKNAAAQGKASPDDYRDALREIARISGADESKNGDLYRFAAEHAEALAGYSDAELGAVGCLAVADWFFSRKHYEQAADRYKRLSLSGDPAIKKRMDEVWFRLGYCQCQREDWLEASRSFELLFDKFPGSSCREEAACLYYAAAAQAYKQRQNEPIYESYIRAARYFLQYCKKTEGRSEARFQLGIYYQRSGKTKEAFNQFSRVEEGTARYDEARCELLKADVEALETFFRQGRIASGNAQKTYQSARGNLAACKRVGTRLGEAKNDTARAADMLILEASLYRFGSDADCRRALVLLSGFENCQRGQKGNGQHLQAEIIRIEVLLRLQMQAEAEAAIAAFIGSGPVQSRCWGLLSECASRLYEASRSARRLGDAHRAGKLAGNALVVYARLFDAVQQDAALKEFLIPIRLRMAELYAEGDRRDAAKQIYQDMLAHGSNSADAVYNLGLIYEKEGQWEDALASWRKFAGGLSPGSFHWFEAKYHTALSLGQTGKGRESCELLTMIEVLHPDLRDAEYKERFLKLRDKMCSAESASPGNDKMPQAR